MNNDGSDPLLPPPRSPSRSSGVGCGTIFLIVFLLGSLLLNFVLCMGLGASGVGDLSFDSHLNEKFHSGNRSATDKIAIVKIGGTIMDGLLSYPHQQIDQAARDNHVKAVIVRIDSPGGSITASDDLLLRLENLRDGTLAKHPGAPKPLIVSMGGLCASGGYYVSMAAKQDDKKLELPRLFAERSCITGSIGVYASLPNATGLAEKIGVKMELIKAGDIKGSGSPFHTLTPQERQPWQDMVNHGYQQFLGVVETGRPVLKGKLTEPLFPPKPVAKYNDKGEVIDNKGGEYTRKLADGGIFTAQEAVEYKLIDRVGTLDDAIAELARQNGISSWRAISYEKPLNLMTLLSGDDSSAKATLPSPDFTPRLWYLLPASEIDARVK